MSRRVVTNSPVNYGSMSAGYKYRTRPGHDTTSTKHESGSAGRYRSVSNLPTGPLGAFGMDGRRMSPYEGNSTVPRKTKETSGIGRNSNLPFYSRYSFESQHSTSLSSRKSSEPRDKLRTTSINDTSSSSLKQGK